MDLSCSCLSDNTGLPLWKDGGETNVKKEKNGRESLRRLKPIVVCNASKRRRRSGNFLLISVRNYHYFLCNNPEECSSQDYVLLRCDTLQSGRYRPALSTRLLSPSSSRRRQEVPWKRMVFIYWTKWNYIPEDHNVNDLLFPHIILYVKRFIRSVN